MYIHEFGQPGTAAASFYYYMALVKAIVLPIIIVELAYLVFFVQAPEKR